jgi:hypothetical protein
MVRAQSPLQQRIAERTVRAHIFTETPSENVITVVPVERPLQVPQRGMQI